MGALNKEKLNEKVCMVITCCNQWSVDTILDSALLVDNKNTRLFKNGWLPIWTTPPEASTSLKNDEWPVVVPGSKPFTWSFLRKYHSNSLAKANCRTAVSGCYRLSSSAPSLSRCMSDHSVSMLYFWSVQYAEISHCVIIIISKAKVLYSY